MGSGQRETFNELSLLSQDCLIDELLEAGISSFEESGDSEIFPPRGIIESWVLDREYDHWSAVGGFLPSLETCRLWRSHPGMIVFGGLTAPPESFKELEMTLKYFDSMGRTVITEDELNILKLTLDYEPKRSEDIVVTRTGKQYRIDDVSHHLGFCDSLYIFSPAALQDFVDVAKRSQDSWACNPLYQALYSEPHDIFML